MSLDKLLVPKSKGVLEECRWAMDSEDNLEITRRNCEPTGILNNKIGKHESIPISWYY